MAIEYLTKIVIMYNCFFSVKETMSPLTQKNFTFKKEAIYKEPEETVRYSSKSNVGQSKTAPLFKSKDTKISSESPQEVPGNTTTQPETSNTATPGAFLKLQNISKAVSYLNIF